MYEHPEFQSEQEAAPASSEVKDAVLAASADLLGDQDEVILLSEDGRFSISIEKEKEAAAEPYLINLVTLEEGRIPDNYHSTIYQLSRIPDGLAIEKYTHYDSLSERAASGLSIEEFWEKEEEHNQKLEEDLRTSRELGLTWVSQKEADDLLGLLREAKTVTE